MARLLLQWEPLLQVIPLLPPSSLILISTVPDDVFTGDYTPSEETVIDLTEEDKLPVIDIDDSPRSEGNELCTIEPGGLLTILNQHPDTDSMAVYCVNPELES